MDKNIINIALFGLGRIGQMHAENLINHPEFNLKYIFDIDKKSRITVEEDKYIDQTISLYLTQENSDRLYMVRLNRTSDTLDVSYVDTNDGSIKFLNSQ